MPVILYTGLPGHGKTSGVISDLMNVKEYQDRVIYTEGIPDLKLNNAIAIDGTDQKMERWYEWAPDGALLVIDEAQRVFRPLSPSAARPKHYTDIETHRHTGIDFLLITQNPKFIDSHVRDLVERHVHVLKTMLGVRKKLEFLEVMNNPSSPSAVSQAVTNSVIKHDKKVFGLYKSATMHTKMPLKLHKIVYFLPFLLIFILYAGNNFYKRFFNSADSEKVQIEKLIDEENTETGVLSSVKPSKKETIPKGSDAMDYVPRLSEKPETKPLYDDIKQVQAFEYPEVCISSVSKCTCYSNQGTKLKEVTDSVCRNYAENGLFNPYKAPKLSAESSSSQPQPNSKAIIN